MRKNGDRSTDLERLLGCAHRASIRINAEGVPFALLPGETSNQSDVAPLHSCEFATFLREQYYDQYHHFPTEALLRVVRDLLDRHVRGAGTSAPVALRVAGGEVEQDGEPGQPQLWRQVFAFDLGRCSPAAPDAVLEIGADGWSVNHSSGFAFLRPRGHRPLPLPRPAGPQALTALRDLLRVDDPDWPRILTWLLAALRPMGPYPLLVLQGQPGSGKTQAAKMLKSLLDAAAAPFHPLPTNPNTLLRQANQSWIQAFDHVTTMPKKISAALCRLCTNAGFSLLVDGSPITISLARPILITVPTGASGPAWKPTGDLLDRMLTVTLPPLTAERTRPESEIADRFGKARPQILGALAQAVSVAMGRLDQIHLASYPRNAEAAVWAIAAAPALDTTPESLQQALQQKSPFHLQDPLVPKLATLMVTQKDWQGTATQLKLELDLSDAPNHLSRKLKDVQATLQDHGIEIAFPPRQANGQLIRISKVHQEAGGTYPSAADLPVGSVDSTCMPNPMAVPPKIHRQIVTVAPNKGETIALPSPPDHQALMPAANGTAPPAELPPGARRHGTGTREANHPSRIVSPCPEVPAEPGLSNPVPGWVRTAHGG